MEDCPRPWVKYYNPDKTPETLTYPDVSVYEFVRQASNRFPEKIAYEFEGKTTTYREFMRRTDHLAACLYESGVRKGDNVIICMPNSPQTVQMFYAVVKCGAVSTMIHPLSAKNEIKYYLNNAEVKVAMVFNGVAQNFIDVQPETDLKTLIVADIADELSFLKSVGFKLTKGRKIPKVPELDFIIKWKDFLKITDKNDIPYVENKGHDCAAILYSGGTTGVPKGVMLSNLNMNAMAKGMLAASEGFSESIDTVYSDEAYKVMYRDYVVLSVMPMFHGFGLVVGVHTFLSFGGKCVLVPTFTPDSFAKLIVDKRPNYIAGVPTLYERMIRSDVIQKADLSCLDGMFCGGDALQPEQKKKIDEFLKSHNSHTIIREGYGLTESVAATCLTPINNPREGSIGIPFPDVYFKIFEVGTSTPVPYGEVGEICISGPNVMLGYYNNPEETANALKVHEDGRTWLHTGDLGKMDEDGYVYFAQRYKRMIISSGYNIYPTQVEAAINSFPGVVESCAIGIPDPVRQERIKVFIVLEKGVVGDDEFIKKIRLHCKDYLAKYAIPKNFEFVESLPRTKVGKIAFRDLEELEAKRRAEKAKEEKKE